MRVEALDARAPRARRGASGCRSRGTSANVGSRAPSNASRTSRPSSRPVSSSALQGSVSRVTATRPCVGGRRAIAAARLPSGRCAACTSTWTGRCSARAAGCSRAPTARSRCSARARSRRACARTSRSSSCRAAGATSAVEDARLFGQGSCIFEIGAGVVLEGETHWLTGAWQPERAHDPRADRRRPARRSCCSRSTAAAWRSTRPWHTGREVSPSAARPRRHRGGQRAARRARPRGPRADRQRRGAPPLARARRAARGPRLPPAPARRLEGERRRGPPADARLRAGGLRRDRRLARGSRRRRAPSAPSGSSPTRSSATRACATRSPATATSRSPRARTAPASTRRSSARWRSAGR